MDQSQSAQAEAYLTDDLARGNRALRSLAPIISHLLDNTGPALVTEAIVARLRGMLSDLAAQLFQACDHNFLGSPAAQDNTDALAEELASDSELVNHLYALALEGYLSERLERQGLVDPVLSPLLQELIASNEPAKAEMAMQTLAAQSRFMQSQRRMGLALGELHPELFLSVINTAKANAAIAAISGSKRSLKSVRKRFDEGAGRLGLLARLIASMRQGTVAALNLEHAGLALFVTAIAATTKQPRDLAVLSCHERQTARLALALRAAGLSREAIEHQFVMLGPVESLPWGIAEIAPDRARDLLSGAAL